MPTGFFVRRKKEDGFVKSFPHPISYTAIEWLVHVEKETGVQIQHARNNREHRIGKVYVDGYCR